MLGNQINTGFHQTWLHIDHLGNLLNWNGVFEAPAWRMQWVEKIE
jgi:hypothetical protein